ncbi:hypothetical protein AOQ84DRAFT_370817 [Glonium stellatum]|uniref:Uncharacterized protein n=1 Tax=Glonium stellatum TaxID=574774 RepID=A0A8E2FD18_9PEZI|nr:hypothetical protein AOQ84DRAFT_370817 [Glonium stellatum]
MPRKTFINTELNNLTTLLSTDPIVALHKLNPFIRPAAPANPSADNSAKPPAPGNEGAGDAAKEPAKVGTRQGRLAVSYEWEMDSVSGGSTAGDEFEKVDWRIEGTGWAASEEVVREEAVREGEVVYEVTHEETVYEETVREEVVYEEVAREEVELYQSREVEMGDEWVGIWLIGAKKGREAREKARQQARQQAREKKERKEKKDRRGKGKGKAPEKTAQGEEKLDNADRTESRSYNLNKKQPDPTPFSFLPQTRNNA